MVTVVACMFFRRHLRIGACTVSAIGSFMIPAMHARRYDDAFAAALTAAAGSIGVIIPPSIPFVIFGVVSGASVGELFMAGIVPGIVIGCALMGVSYIIARKKGFAASAKEGPRKSLWASFKESVWALMVPVIILEASTEASSPPPRQPWWQWSTPFSWDVSFIRNSTSPISTPRSRMPPS
jgi:C4-dicarboxylate transporter DctM subunit